MKTQEINAADDLSGKTLATGWVVIEKIEKAKNATGAFFSVCYKVAKNNQICFLKAFDFAKFFQIAEQGSIANNNPPPQIVDVMANMINAFKYEKDLSDLCKNEHVTKVSFVRDSGEEVVDGYSISIVPYLIFDLADGDVRAKIDFSHKLDFAWRLKSLHDIAVGLKQLHNIEVSHQDLKPSNILLFDEDSKIGDLGRSICKQIRSPHDGNPFPGDYNYAPPEIMYRYYEKDWHRRLFATDCYLLGSMIVFYFSGISMSALLLKHIPRNFRWDVWRGTFSEVKPYIIDAFSQALNEVESSIKDDYFRRELRWLVERLCYPFPEGRGHPKNIAGRGSFYSLERFITKLDLLHKRAQYLLRH